jgi:hypothetical protein
MLFFNKYKLFFTFFVNFVGLKKKTLRLFIGGLLMMQARKRDSNFEREENITLEMKKEEERRKKKRRNIKGENIKLKEIEENKRKKRQ